MPVRDRRHEPKSSRLHCESVAGVSPARCIVMAPHHASDSTATHGAAACAMLSTAGLASGYLGQPAADGFYHFVRIGGHECRRCMVGRETVGHPYTQGMPHIGLAPHRDHEYVGMLGGGISHHACPANPLPAAARADHAPGVCGHPPGPAARPPVLITLRSYAQRPAGKSDALPAGTWRMVRPKTAYSKTPTSTRWIVGKRISGQTGEVPV